MQEELKLFVNLIHKIIPVKIYKIHKAIGFYNSILNFKYKKQYCNICRDIISGNNLNDYLSIKSKKLYNDKLLNYFNIYHFHFDKRKKKRTNELLFFMMDEDNIYFIGIGNHAHFYKKDIIEKAELSFPHLFKNYLYDGEITDIREVDYLESIKGNSTFFLKLNNKIYLAPIVSNGMSVDEVRLYDEIIK